MSLFLLVYTQDYFFFFKATPKLLSPSNSSKLALLHSQSTSPSFQAQYSFQTNDLHASQGQVLQHSPGEGTLHIAAVWQLKADFVVKQKVTCIPHRLAGDYLEAKLYL